MCIRDRYEGERSNSSPVVVCAPASNTVTDFIWASQRSSQLSHMRLPMQTITFSLRRRSCPRWGVILWTFICPDQQSCPDCNGESIALIRIWLAALMSLSAWSCIVIGSPSWLKSCIGNLAFMVTYCLYLCLRCVWPAILCWTCFY